MAGTRATLVRNGLAESLDGTVRIDAHGDPVVDVGWLDGVTLWLLSDIVEHVSTGATTTFQELIDNARLLDDVPVD